MLLSLSIRNYALIDDLKVNFRQGLSTITGETGAGKSILLGGLSLVLGKRADTALVYKKDRKCIVEAEFGVEEYDLKGFFSSNDLDYDPLVYVRREILPNGKSRAFINDTPVNLQTLSELSKKLIDIHSQHETLKLSESEFQFRIIDAIAGNMETLKGFRSDREALSKMESELRSLHEMQAEANRAYDYHSFLCKELREASLDIDEQEELEAALEKLSHIEEIKANLSEVTGLAEMENYGLLEAASRIRQALSRIGPYAKSYAQLSERWESIWIEIKDVLSEVEAEDADLEHDPAQQEKVEDRLQLLYDLQKKHMVESVEALLEVQERLEKEIHMADTYQEKIDELSAKIETLRNRLHQVGLDLHHSRMKVIPVLVSQVEELLGRLEMKNTRLKVRLEKVEALNDHGLDRMEFLLSSDKGANFEHLKKIASGGELSRIMLAVKSILSDYQKLPAIIFDEIDTGVSGEVSKKISELMSSMSKNMQVITITHLPQVAARGTHHYKVYKEESASGVTSNIRLLNDKERLVELAQMLSGSQVTDSAIAHAKELLS